MPLTVLDIRKSKQNKTREVYILHCSRGGKQFTNFKNRLYSIVDAKKCKGEKALQADRKMGVI